jgi:hypothetical protein
MTITSADIMEFYPKNIPKPTISDLETDIIRYDNDDEDEDESELLFFEPYQRLQTFTLTNIIRDIYHYIFHN